MEKFELARIIIRPVCLILAFALLGGKPASAQQTASGGLQLSRSLRAGEPVTSWSVHANQSGEINYIAFSKKNALLLANGITRQLALPALTVLTVTSKQGNYFAVASRADDGGNRTPPLLIEIYTNAGQKLYELRRPLPYDDALPQILVSDRDGAAILGHAPTGTVSWFDPDGAPRAQVALFPDADYDLERVLHMALSEDGSRLAVAAEISAASPAGAGAPALSPEPRLFAFDESGRELWRQPLAGANALTAAISPDGSFVAASSYSANIAGDVKKFSRIFDAAGRVIATPDILFKRAAFSPDSRRVVLAENNRLAALALPSGKILWKRNIPRSEGIIAAVDISGGAGLAAVLLGQSRYRGDGFIFVNPILKLLDASGSVPRQSAFADKTFTRPALVLAKNQGGILLGFSDALNTYEIK